LENNSSRQERTLKKKKKKKNQIKEVIDIFISGNGTTNGKSSDSKAIKETNVPNEIALTVQNFK
jgi:hypothetical protein